MLRDQLGRVLVRVGNVIKPVPPEKVQADLERVLKGTGLDGGVFEGYADDDMTIPVLRNVRAPKPIIKLPWRRKE